MAERRHGKVFGTIAKDLANRDMSLRRQLATVVRDNDALKNTTDILQQWRRRATAGYERTEGHRRHYYIGVFYRLSRPS